MNKKAMAIGLIAAMMLSTGCGGSAGSSATSETSSAGTSADNSSSAQTDTQTSEQSSVTDSSKQETTGESQSETTSKTGDEIAPGVITNGQVVVKLDDHYWGISLYGGGTGDSYASYVNEFKEKVGSTVNVFNMVVPTASAFYLPEDYSQYNASHLDTINNIANKLSGVINVDGYSALEAHKDEYIYTRTDHHWMPLGAYYAAQAFAKSAAVDFADLSTYEKCDVDGYVGSLYTFTQNADLLNDPEVFSYYVVNKDDYTATYYTTDFKADAAVSEYHSLYVEQPASSAYSTFMGGDEKIVKIQSNVCKNGRKLMILKDSYGNAEVPFLVNSFEEVYVCDMRYFDTNAIDFVKNQGITDVLFTMCTFSAVGDNAEGIKTIMNN